MALGSTYICLDTCLETGLVSIPSNMNINHMFSRLLLGLLDSDLRRMQRVFV